jgi:hypothetical protein
MVRGLIRGASGCAVASHSVRSCAQTFMMYGTLSGASLRRRRASARISSFDIDTGRPPDRRMDGTWFIPAPSVDDVNASIPVPTRRNIAQIQRVFAGPLSSLG